jgi:hypothetical protein
LHNIVARYLAFGLSLVFKYRDGWDSAFWEVVIVGMFLAAVGVRYTFPVYDEKTVPKISQDDAVICAGATAAALFIFVVQESQLLFGDDGLGAVLCSGVLNLISGLSLRVVNGVGVAVYYGWKCVPMKKFKSEDYTALPSSFI